MAILGIEQSPSCCVNYIYTNNFNNNNNGIKLAIGSKPKGSAEEEVDWICQISEKEGNATSLICYFVLPENSDYSFENKLIWLTRNSEGLNPISNYVSFSKEINLIAGRAKIITLNVQQGNSTTVADEYNISK